MKALFMILVLVPYVLFGQDMLPAEPEFLNSVYFYPQATGIPLVKLEQQIPHQKTRANLSTYLVGIGGAKTLMRVHQPYSTVRLRRSQPLRFIIRMADNQFDPTTMFQIVQLESTRKVRKSEVASINLLGMHKSGDLDYIPFQGKKFGESSYLIEISQPLKPGEYAIRINTQNTVQHGTVSQVGVNEIWNLFGLQ